MTESIIIFALLIFLIMGVFPRHAGFTVLVALTWT